MWSVCFCKCSLWVCKGRISSEEGCSTGVKIKRGFRVLLSTGSLLFSVCVFVFCVVRSSPPTPTPHYKLCVRWIDGILWRIPLRKSLSLSNGGNHGSRTLRALFNFGRKTARGLVLCWASEAPGATLQSDGWRRELTCGLVLCTCCLTKSSQTNPLKQVWGSLFFS